MNSGVASTGVILAGGKSTRMGCQDKGLLVLDGKTLIERAIDRLQPQVQTVIISANRNLHQYQSYGYPVIADNISGFNGPLAGIASTMIVAKTPYIVTVACDTPFFPVNLVERLYQALRAEQGTVSVVRTAEHMQSVFALINCELLASLTDYLMQEGRKVETWLRLQKLVEVDFSDCPSAFLNINTPEDFDAVELRLKTQGGS